MVVAATSKYWFCPEFVDPNNRETPQRVPFSCPERLPVPAGASKVSQNAGNVPAGALKSWHPDEVGVTVNVESAKDRVPAANSNTAPSNRRVKTIRVLVIKVGILIVFK